MHVGDKLHSTQNIYIQTIQCHHHHHHEGGKENKLQDHLPTEYHSQVQPIGRNEAKSEVKNLFLKPGIFSQDESNEEEVSNKPCNTTCQVVVANPQCQTQLPHRCNENAKCNHPRQFLQNASCHLLSETSADESSRCDITFKSQVPTINSSFKPSSIQTKRHQNFHTGTIIESNKKSVRRRKSSRSLSLFEKLQLNILKITNHSPMETEPDMDSIENLNEMQTTAV